MSAVRAFCYTVGHGVDVAAEVLGITAPSRPRVARATGRLALLESDALPRELFWASLALPPLLAIIFEPYGYRHTLSHQVRTLVAIWGYTAIVAGGMHVATNLIERRWPTLLLGPRGVAIHLLVIALVITGLTEVLQYPAGYVCEGLYGRGDALLARGLIVGGVYLVVGRVVARFRQKSEQALVAAETSARLAAEAKYAALITRTQPHFLSNALITAASYTSEDPTKAKRFLGDLASLFRDVTTGSTRERVRVADEMRTMERYLSVQRDRFAPRLTFTCETNPLASEELLPPLVSLPLVENAVLHGLSTGKSLEVRVTTALTDDHVELTVRDTGPGLGASTHHGSGVATADLRERLVHLYGAGASLTIENASPGVVASLRIPRED